jgi:hypothetical protein
MNGFPAQPMPDQGASAGFPSRDGVVRLLDPSDTLSFHPVFMIVTEVISQRKEVCFIPEITVCFRFALL